MIGSVLLIASAALHALWNALIKKDAEPRINSVAVLLVALVFTFFTLPFSSQPFFSNRESIWWALAAGLFEGGYLATLALALEISSLGTIYTVSRGGAMLVVWLFSSALLGESVTGKTVLGTFFVLIGIILTHWSATNHNEKKGRFGWAYLCAFFIAGYHLFYGQALKTGAEPTPLFFLSLGLGFPIYLMSCERGTTQKVKKKFLKKPIPLFLGGIFCAFSFLLFLKGLSYTGAGVAITLRNTSILFAQVFSLWIGEKHSKLQWGGAALVAIGASLITLP